MIETELTTDQNIHNEMNIFHIFKITHDINNSIDFLDLTLTRVDNKLTANIFRKPTTTDTTIHFLSNNPLQQQQKKTADYKSYLQSTYTLPLTQQGRQSELNTTMHVR
jgi:hypothetical protein